MSAFAFNTTESLPIALLRLISADLDVSASSTDYLVTTYGLTVAVESLPLAIATRNVLRRHLLSAVRAALAVGSATGVLVASCGYGCGRGRVLAGWAFSLHGSRWRTPTVG